MTRAAEKKAVVLVSGGMDSAVTLALAREDAFACYALSVDYGQRHASELTAADRIAKILGAAKVRSQTDTLRRVDVTVILGKDFRAPPGLHP